MDVQPVTDMAWARPSPGLRPLVSQYVGYRLEGHPPGTHLGLPSASITIVISLGAPTDIRTWHDGYAGTAPKDAARVTRFHRSRRLLERPDRPPLSELAAISGYADQSHLAREWNDLAGRPPSEWIADEELPFVQDEAGKPVAA